jgi:hypothetical protein
MAQPFASSPCSGGDVPTTRATMRRCRMTRHPPIRQEKLLSHPAAGAGRARQILAFVLACLVIAGTLAARSVSDASAEQDMAGSWTTLAPTGLKRQEVSFTEAGGKLYLFGGTSTERQQVYTPETNSWADTAPAPAVPGALDHVQGVTVGGRIYYIGGLTAWPSPDVGTVHIYDPATNRWSTGTDMGDRRRGAGGVAVHDGKIYYAGGIHDGRAVDWLDRYDPATGSGPGSRPCRPPATTSRRRSSTASSGRSAVAAGPGDHEPHRRQRGVRPGHGDVVDRPCRPADAARRLRRRGTRVRDHHHRGRGRRPLQRRLQGRPRLPPGHEHVAAARRPRAPAARDPGRGLRRERLRRRGRDPSGGRRRDGLPPAP